MRLLYIPLILIGLMLPSPVRAEFYKYVDQKGVVHYTDNLAEVPKDQRPGVATYSQPEDFAKPEEAAETAAPEAAAEPGEKAAEPSGGGAEETTKGTRTVNTQAAAEVERLQKIQNDLDQEYDSLMVEQEALKKAREAIKVDKDMRAHNEKVRALNQRITDYEKRRKAFKKEADAFNSTQGQ